MNTPSSPRDPHEPYVRAALSPLRGADESTHEDRGRRAPAASEHHFELPRVTPAAHADAPDSADW